METTEQLNSEFLDLYGNIFEEFVKLESSSNFDDIKDVCKTNSIIGFEHKIKVGDKCIIAEIKYTWSGGVVKTAYLHIKHVKSFESPILLTYWREQKDGSFKTV
jgi:hypothetical protein